MFHVPPLRKNTVFTLLNNIFIFNKQKIPHSLESLFWLLSNIIVAAKSHKSELKLLTIPG